MTKHNENAFPQHVFTPYRDGGGVWMNEGGMTKREEFAKAAMQGLLASPHFIDPDGLWTGNGAQPTAEAAVLLADALIAELAKGGDA